MTNQIRIPQSAQVRKEAIAWVLKFNGDVPASMEDIEQLRLWAARSSVHRRALQQAQDFWGDANVLTELAVPINRSPSFSWRQLISRLFSGQRVFAGRLVLSMSLLCCIGLGLSAWYYTSDKSLGNGIYTTQIGEQRRLLLKDQSTLQLDTNSSIRVAYNEGKRQIFLLRGKAHFQVAKNPNRPFEVHAASGLVRAVGTAFSVALNGRELEVTVDEGRVDLARVPVIASARTSVDLPLNPSGPAPVPVPTAQVFASLGMGQSASFDQQRQQVSDLPEKELRRKMAWRQGVLVFTGEPLSQVVSEVNRYSKIKVEISDPQLEALAIGGRFRVGELEALFDVLKFGFDVDVSYVDDNHVQLQSNSKNNNL